MVLTLGAVLAARDREGVRALVGSIRIRLFGCIESQPTPACIDAGHSVGEVTSCHAD